MENKLKMDAGRPTILITNDDGVYSKGITELIAVAREFGNVVVVAPDGGRSGMSSAITHTKEVHLNKLHDEPGFVVFACDGTPVDCVKVSLFALFSEKYPDLLLSGINHGSNASVNAVYSATVGAATEGCTNNVQTVAFSLCDHDADADFSYALVEIRKIIDNVLKNPLPYATFLNVNFPVGPLQGMKVCRQSDACWSEEYTLIEHPYGRLSYQLAGFYVCREPEATDTDNWALTNHYGSIVPSQIDRTNYDSLTQLKSIYE